jgi:hypothetical protein
MATASTTGMMTAWSAKSVRYLTRPRIGDDAEK